MEAAMRAIEMTGSIDENQQLRLDEPLPFAGPARVRVIVLYSWDDDLNEAEWLQAASRNPAFASLDDPEEDIYTLDDGKPFNDAV